MPAYCSLCGTEATLSFSAGPVCSSFSAVACAILHAFCWSRQHQQVCHFCFLLLMSDFCSVLFSVFLLHQSSCQELSSLFSCSIRPQLVSEHSFLPGNNAADELARLGVLLVPSTIPCSFSPLISRIHSCLFSYWRRTILLTLSLPRSSIDDLVFSVFTSNFFKLSYKISLIKNRFVTLFFIRFS